VDTLIVGNSSPQILWKTGPNLRIKGTPIGPLDTMIAAHALSLDKILVTNNLKEFNRIPDLQLENWV
jgi:tRNA(fMet)-specific endonuclease VapC